MSNVVKTKLSEDGQTLHAWMSISDESGEQWQPVVYGNMDENKPYPIIVRLPISGQMLYFVEDDLKSLARIVLREDRVFHSMKDAIAKAEQLAGSEEWQIKNRSKIEECISATEIYDTCSTPTSVPARLPYLCNQEAWACPVCNGTIRQLSNYCPHCGAKVVQK